MVKKVNENNPILVEEDFSKLTFEEAFAKLKSIVEKLQEENTTLEETMKFYAIGKQLSTHCNSLLGEAKFEIESVLSHEQGKVKLNEE